MTKVVCVNIRESIPNQIEVGKHYYLDMESKINYSGDDYAPVYDEDGNEIANAMKISHFKEIL